MTITGTIPNVIASLLKKENQSLNGIEIKGNDIDVVLVDDGIYTELYAIGMGNGTFEIIELEDNLNLLPEYDVGDVVSNDVLRKLFYTVINSSLILSFNPLGEVKYGIKDKIDNLKEKAQNVKDWANNTLYAEDAEKWIRGNGPYRRTFTDARDGQTRTKKDYNAGRINVGKIQQLNDEGKGHYKVLSGNPATQDFQVWHLYKNGNKIRCVDLKTGLKAQEAQWVYDNNIPNSWSEADWNPEGEIPEKASKIEVGETQEQKNQTEESQTEETTEEDNVEEGEMEQTEESQTEEDDDLHEFVKDYYSGKGDFEVLEQSFDPFEEDNVIDSDKKKKKSKYNGCNVTGCVEGDGTVALASFIRQNLMDFYKSMGKKNITGEPEKQLNKVMAEIKSLLSVNPKLVSEMTKSSKDNLVLDFSVFPEANMKYLITLDFTDKGVQVSGSGLPEVGDNADEINANKLKFTLDCLDKVAKKIAGV